MVAWKKVGSRWESPCTQKKNIVLNLIDISMSHCYWFRLIYFSLQQGNGGLHRAKQICINSLILSQNRIVKIITGLWLLLYVYNMMIWIYVICGVDIKKHDSPL